MDQSGNCTFWTIQEISYSGPIINIDIMDNFRCFGSFETDTESDQIELDTESVSLAPCPF